MHLVRPCVFLFTNDLQIFCKQSEESSASLLKAKRKDLRGAHSRWHTEAFVLCRIARNLSILENNERTHYGASSELKNGYVLLQDLVCAGGWSLRPAGGERVVRARQRALRVPREGGRLRAHAARAGPRAHRAHGPACARAVARLARAVAGGPRAQPLLLQLGRLPRTHHQVRHGFCFIIPHTSGA